MPTVAPSSFLHSSKDLTTDVLLRHAVTKLKKLIKCSPERTRYQHLLLPSLPTFVKHISSQCRLSPAILVVALIYLGRLEQNLPNLACGEYDTPYKIFLAAILLASKYMDDSSFVTRTVRKSIAPLYSSRELAEMERSFLGVVKFDLYVDLAHVSDYVQGLHIPLSTIMQSS